jgi:hypothetical protein
MYSIATTIKINKNWLYISALSLIMVGVFLLIQPAWAISAQSALLSMVGWLIMPVVSFLGNVLLILIEILIGIFSFTEFIDTPAVQLGWVIIRDLANMAIVIALIIISFATVFRIQRYAASQLLIKLIIAAALVNFSLLIAGLLIDFGQVIMMTFVNQFEALAAGNLTVGFGIEDMLKVATTNTDIAAGSYGSVIGAMFLAVVLLLVAIAVILVLIVVLLQRIIYLWILAIFSPMAWVAPLLPGGSSWGSSWWTNFSKQVFIGPLLAFGFWLSMSVLAGLTANQSLVSLTIQNTNLEAIGEQSSTQIARFVSEVSTPQAIFDFMITIGLLLGTLWMAKQAGGAAASFAGTSFNKFSKAPGAILKRTARPITDRYAAYKSQRESARKEGVQRFGRRLSGYRDLTLGRVTGGIKRAGGYVISGRGTLGQKGLDRNIARGLKARRDIEKEDTSMYEDRYNFNKMGRQDARVMAVSGKDKKGRKVNDTIRRRAMIRAAQGEGTFFGLEGDDDAQALFDLIGGENKFPELYQQYEDLMKKTNPETLLGTQSFGYIAKFDPDRDPNLPPEVINGFTSTIGKQEVAEEVMNGNITAKVLDNPNLQKILDLGSMDDKLGRNISGGTSAYMFEIAPDAARIEQVLGQLETATVDKMFGKKAGKYFRDEDKDSNGKYFNDNKAKIYALGRSGAGKAAFFNLDEGYDRSKIADRTAANRNEELFAEFMSIDKNKNQLSANMTETSMEDPSFLRAIQKVTPRAQIEKERDNKEHFPILKESVVSQFEAHGEIDDDLINRGVLFVREVVDDKGNKTGKVRLLKDSTNLDKDGYDKDTGEKFLRSNTLSPDQTEDLKKQTEVAVMNYTDTILNEAGKVVRKDLEHDNLSMRRWAIILNRSLTVKDRKGAEKEVFDMKNEYAQEALTEFLKRSWVVGTNFRNNKFNNLTGETDPDKQTTDDIKLNIMTDNMRFGDIGLIAQRNSVLAKQMVGMMVDKYDAAVKDGSPEMLNMAKDLKNTLRAINKSPYLSGTVPGRLFEEVEKTKEK